VIDRPRNGAVDDIQLMQRNKTALGATDSTSREKGKIERDETPPGVIETTYRSQVNEFGIDRIEAIDITNVEGTTPTINTLNNNEHYRDGTYEASADVI
jgi:hypothetical protein